MECLIDFASDERAFVVGLVIGLVVGVALASILFYRRALFILKQRDE